MPLPTEVAIAGAASVVVWEVVVAAVVVPNAITSNFEGSAVVAGFLAAMVLMGLKLEGSQPTPAIVVQLLVVPDVGRVQLNCDFLRGDGFFLNFQK